MSTEDRIKKLDFLYELIEKKRAGPPKKVAAKLFISVSTLTRFINFLEELKGVKIEYSRSRGSYVIIDAGDSHAAEI